MSEAESINHHDNLAREDAHRQLMLRIDAVHAKSNRDDQEHRNNRLTVLGPRPCEYNLVQYLENGGFRVLGSRTTEREIIALFRKIGSGHGMFAHIWDKSGMVLLPPRPGSKPVLQPYSDIFDDLEAAKEAEALASSATEASGDRTDTPPKTARTTKQSTIEPDRSDASRS